MRKIRIRNHTMLMQLASVVRLGSVNVSVQLLVEAWQQAGGEVGESFFLHHESLLDCGFLTVTKEPPGVDSLAGTLTQSELDSQVSITDQGREYLDRFGNR
ncbi:MAG: hypothetical protein KTR35_00565 [Gammaproteobacteria bacterium]|nr:hypothetical protein [Gammaproteobacteria bacterium]